MLRTPSRTSKLKRGRSSRRWGTAPQRLAVPSLCGLQAKVVDRVVEFVKVRIVIESAELKGKLSDFHDLFLQPREVVGDRVEVLHRVVVALLQPIDQNGGVLRVLGNPVLICLAHPLKFFPPLCTILLAPLSNYLAAALRQPF